MGNFNGRKKMVFMVAMVLSVSMALSSCDSLKKKFIRQKKKGMEEQTFVPVLVPEEYPTPAQNPELNYKTHYDLIKAWYKDLWQAIDDKSTARYLHYIISQVTNHIEQMKALVDTPTRVHLIKLQGFLDYYKSSLDYPWQMRNVPRIQSDLRAFDRYLRDNLRADRIKGHFVKSGK